MRLVPFVLAFGLIGAPAAMAAPAPLPASPGEATAQRLCGGCHSLGPASAGRLGAPAFRDIALRYNELSLERRLSRMRGHRHSSMPRFELTPGEVSDLASYIAGSR